MDLYLFFVIFSLTLSFAVDAALAALELKGQPAGMPEEFRGMYDPEAYGRSQSYLRESTRFGIVESFCMFAATVAFIIAGGFNVIDLWARSLGGPEIISGLAFAAMLLVLSDLARLPFSAYATFGIEQRYGFNTSSARTFAADHLKGWMLTAALGGPLLGLLLWLFQEAGSTAWLYCWAAVTAFRVLMLFAGPAVILPLFNTFTPLADGELRAAIESYAAGQDFPFQGIYTIDGSRRSTKSNAFFTGIGRSRRIALFDTLIGRLAVPEVVAVLAHEIGHYKKGHIARQLALSTAAGGAALYLMSLFIGSSGLSEAFGMEHVSIYSSLCFFAFLYLPMDLLMSVGAKMLSRKHEFEADAFAAKTSRNPDAMVEALKKLSRDNFSNLSPHPATVFFKYSHPPVLERIRRLRAISQ